MQGTLDPARQGQPQTRLPEAGHSLLHDQGPETAV